METLFSSSSTVNEKDFVVEFPEIFDIVTGTEQVQAIEEYETKYVTSVSYFTKLFLLEDSTVEKSRIGELRLFSLAIGNGFPDVPQKLSILWHRLLSFPFKEKAKAILDGYNLINNPVSIERKNLEILKKFIESIKDKSTLLSEYMMFLPENAVFKIVSNGDELVYSISGVEFPLNKTTFAELFSFVEKRLSDLGEGKVVDNQKEMEEIVKLDYSNALAVGNSILSSFDLEPHDNLNSIIERLETICVVDNYNHSSNLELFRREVIELMENLTQKRMLEFLS